MSHEPHGNCTGQAGCNEENAPKVVYVVEFVIPWEGGDVQGVFTSEEKAKAFIWKHDPEWTPEKKDDHYIVYPVVLNSEEHVDGI